MTVRAIRDHLNNRGKRIRKGTIYQTPGSHGRYLISIGLVEEYKESPRIEKSEFITKPERIEVKKDAASLGWHELRAFAKELGVFSKELNKEELIDRCNKKLNK